MTDAARQAAYLDAMGITRWVRRDLPCSPSTGSHSDAGAGAAEDQDRAAILDRMARKVSECTLCALCRSRTQTVFGVGNPHADWMIVGEGPGEKEDQQGEPFVGPAGKLLNNMLRAVGFRREDVYIANIVKCRPPNNREPRPEEVSSCFPYLLEQIHTVNPRLILAVGRVAAQNLLGVDSPLGKMRGRVYQVTDTGTPVVVTYHPAYLLRSPQQKRRAWEDLTFACKVTEKEAS